MHRNRYGYSDQRECPSQMRRHSGEHQGDSREWGGGQYQEQREGRGFQHGGSYGDGPPWGGQSYADQGWQRQGEQGSYGSDWQGQGGRDSGWTNDPREQGGQGRGPGGRGMYGGQGGPTSFAGGSDWGRDRSEQDGGYGGGYGGSYGGGSGRSSNPYSRHEGSEDRMSPGRSSYGQSSFRGREDGPSQEHNWWSDGGRSDWQRGRGGADRSSSWQGGYAEFQPYGREWDYNRRTYGQGIEPGEWSRSGLSRRSGSEFGDWSASGASGDADRPNRGPKNYTRSDSRIQEEINDRLMGAHEIDCSDIEVKVQNGEVTLTGTVSAKSDKARAEQIAESVLGVQEVVNQLRSKRSNSSGQSGNQSGSQSTGQSGSHSQGGQSQTGQSPGIQSAALSGSGETSTSGSGRSGSESESSGSTRRTTTIGR